MSLGALPGFVLVFVVTAWTMSALGGLVLAAARPALQRLGPMAQRRAAEAVAIVPVVLGVLVVTTLVLHSTLGVDHCAAHDGHAHLCVAHGAQWIDRTWVAVVLASVAATVVARIAIVATSFVRGARSIRELHQVSRSTGEVRLVDSERAFCFVSRLGIYVSSRVWSALSGGERAALVAHEAAHVRHGDLRTRAVLEAFLVFAGPLVGEHVRSTWLQASERLCDAHAAAVTGEPQTVASAMVAMCRLQAGRPAPSFGFTPTAEELAGRVEAVLVGGPLGERAATVLARLVTASCAVIAIVGIVAAGPVHHAFETLLG